MIARAVRGLRGSVSPRANASRRSDVFKPVVWPEGDGKQSASKGKGFCNRPRELFCVGIVLLRQDVMDNPSAYVR